MEDFETFVSRGQVVYPPSMRRLLGLASFCLLLPLAVEARDTGFINRKIAVNGGISKYVVYLPEDYTPRSKWPIILFLHGSGERGTDGLTESQVGLPSAIRQHPERWPFVVVMPQLPYTHHHWPDPDMMHLALSTLDAATKEFHGDPQRTYLTGLSMGGHGTWEIAKDNPGRFAAIVPVCGGIHWSWRPGGRQDPGLAATYARAIGRTPVWIFHGAEDNVVSPKNSDEMYAALKAAGGNVRYFKLEGIQHNAWERAYSNPNLPTWLLAHRLSDVATMPAHAEFHDVPFQPVPAKINTAVYAAYVGDYDLEGVKQTTIAIEAGQLISRTRYGTVTLLPESETSFFLPGGGTTRYIFQHAENGKSPAIIFKDDRHEERWERAR